MFEAMNITKDSQQKAMMLHFLGEETCDIVKTINVPEPTSEERAFEGCVKGISDILNHISVLITMSTCSNNKLRN